MSYGYYNHSSTAAVYSEEEDSSFIASTESSSFEVTPSSSSVLQHSDPLKSELVSEEDSCCCVSTEELSVDIIDQPLVGWKKLSVCQKSSNHRLSAQASEKSLHGSCESCNQTCKANSSSDKLTRSSLSRAVINLGSESKSLLRSYIHSTPAIPFTFRHHLDGDTAAFYMEEYRNSYTYPCMGKRMTVNSASTPATVKPTLFVLDNDCTLNKLPLKRPDSMSGFRKRMNSLGISDSSYHSGNPVPRASQLSKHRELGVPRSSKEYCSAWTGVASSSTSTQSGIRQQSSVSSKGTTLNSGTIENLRISGTYVADTTPVSSPTTPRAGGTVTPITHVKPQPTKIKPQPTKTKPQPNKPTGVHSKPISKSNVKTFVVNVDSLPVTTVYQSQRTVTRSKIKGQSPNHSTRTIRDKYT